MLTLIKICLSDERAAILPVAHHSQHHWWSCRLIWLQLMPRARSAIIRLPVMKWVRCYCHLPGCYKVQVCVCSISSVCSHVNMCVNLLMYNICIANMLSCWKCTITIHDNTTSVEISRYPRLHRSPCNILGLIAFTCWSKSHFRKYNTVWINCLLSIMVWDSWHPCLTIQNDEVTKIPKWKWKSMNINREEGKCIFTLQQNWMC